MSAEAHVGAGNDENGTARPATSLIRKRLSRILKNPVIAIGITMLIVIVLAAALAPVLQTHDPRRITPIERLQSPSSEHWLGTDQLGRDQWSRMLHGARLSIGVGFATTLMVTILGVLIGLLSGYYRRLDNVIMRIMDGMMAFPSILLAIAFIAALGPNARNVVLALTLVYLPRMARVVRGQVLMLREVAYVEAAIAFGGSAPRVMFKHMLPNMFGPVNVQATFVFAYAILAEASLSFLGVGVSPEVPSWGNMLSLGKTYMRQAPWLLLPGFAIMITTLALTLVGDGLRDVFDPRQVD
jgi:peptide/nickel transport system permease protein